MSREDGGGAAQIAALQRMVRQLRRRLEFVEGSKFWQLRAAWVNLQDRIGRREPIEGPGEPAVDFVENMAWPEPYTRWLLENEPRRVELGRLREVAPLLPAQPSVAVFVNDTAGNADAALAAAGEQAYPRVRVRALSQVTSGGDDAARWNAALAACTEDVVAFCEPGDLLAPHAAFEVALAFNHSPGAIAVYGDCDVIAPDGSRSAPRFVPDWSPDTFLSSMYTGRVIFYKRAAVLAAGGFRPGFGPANHYDLALRVFENGSEIVHRPSVLVHRASGDRSAPENGEAVRAVEAALERRGESGHVVAGPAKGVHLVRYDLVRPGRVDVVIPTRDLAAYLDRCLRSLFERNARADLRAIVVDNGSLEGETFATFRRWREREPERFAVLEADGPFNFSRLVNAGVRAGDAPYVLLLNNDAEFVTDDGVRAMLEQAQRPSIGAVGARLLYPDGSLQHVGVVVGVGGYAGHVYRHKHVADPDVDETVAGVRNYSAVTAAAMMFRRDAFDEIGGFNEELAIEFNDLDFCLRLVRAGYRNVSLPHVVLNHEESVSRGTPRTHAARAQREHERAVFQSLWQTEHFADPYYNQNLTRSDETGGLGNG